MYGYELRKLSGTDGTVSLVADINFGPADSFPEDFVVFNGDLYFEARDAEHGRELHKIDRVTGTHDSFDFLPGPGNSLIQIMGVVNDTLAVNIVMDRDGDGPLGL